MYNPESRTYIPGGFITFEGGEGAGKSTVIQHVVSWLQAYGMPCVVTRQPGGTEAGLEIRRLLLKENIRLDPKTELLLFMADRSEHLARTIRPTVSGGGLVICDRYFDSTIAYQGYGRGFDLAEIRRLHEFIGAIEPTLTFWLDVDPSVGLERVRKARGLDRLEGDETLQAYVRAGFQCIAAASPHRVVRIDANRPIEAVIKDVIRILNDHLNGRPVNQAAESLRRSLEEAKRGDRIPAAKMWDFDEIPSA